LTVLYFKQNHLVVNKDETPLDSSQALFWPQKVNFLNFSFVDTYSRSSFTDNSLITVTGSITLSCIRKDTIAFRF
jgi:hypothetical protein